MARISKDELRKLYWDEGMTQKEIGDEIGVSQSQVHKYMRNYGVKVRDRSWSDKEEEILRKIYPHLTPEEVAYVFGEPKKPLLIRPIRWD